MAKLPSITKILRENLPKDSWVDVLISPINRFMEQITQALNKQLTFSDNFDGQVFSNVTVDGTYPLTLNWERSVRPVGVWIVQAKPISATHTPFSSALFVDWEFTSDGKINILAIPGLSASVSTKYYINLIAVTG